MFLAVCFSVYLPRAPRFFYRKRNSFCASCNTVANQQEVQYFGTIVTTVVHVLKSYPRHFSHGLPACQGSAAAREERNGLRHMCMWQCLTCWYAMAERCDPPTPGLSSLRQKQTLGCQIHFEFLVSSHPTNNFWTSALAAVKRIISVLQRVLRIFPIFPFFTTQLLHGLGTMFDFKKM